MEEKQLLLRAEIDEEEWEKTPPSVKRAFVRLLKELEELKEQEKKLAQEKEGLEEKVNQNSSNSHSPPSSQLIKPQTKEEKKKTGKKRGGQPGHLGYSRYLYPVESCQLVRDYHPSNCSCCGEALLGSDPNPYRHQIVEIPPIQPRIEEHRLHQLECEKCGQKNRAKLPPEVESSGYGSRVVSMVAVLSGMYHLSHRQIVTAMSDLFGVKMGLGSVTSLRSEGSRAIEKAVVEAQEYIQRQPIVGADETGFSQKNADGQNGNKRTAWIWVAVTPLVSYFSVILSRAASAAKTLLGENFRGYLNCDRYGAYNWLSVEQKQFCWAHLKREFTKISERTGVAGELGKALLVEEKKLFELWYQVRDGTKTHATFALEVEPIRAAFQVLLQQGAEYAIGSREKTPLAKTVRTCRQLLKAESALWLFVRVEGLEPTNNAAERAIRPAVLWRRVSFGSQSEAGSLFVARMLTVVTSLRSQNRNVLEFMTEAILAARRGTSSPSLLPQSEPLESTSLAA